MSKILILGATGSLGEHVAQQAITANHTVSVFVRSPSRLPKQVRKKATVFESDLAEMPASALANIFQAHDVVINTAGYVAQGRFFTDLIDHIVTGLESIPEKDRPVCWFLAGAALLDMDDSGRRGVDLPVIGSTYWPHQVNFDRIHQTTLDWRILCPGPLVDQPIIGLDRMRISLDQLPIHIPAFLRPLSEESALQFLTQHIHEITVSYADAAALMLAHINPNDEMSHHRVGLALRDGVQGGKS